MDLKNNNTKGGEEIGGVTVAIKIKKKTLKFVLIILGGLFLLYAYYLNNLVFGAFVFAVVLLLAFFTE